ncbi:hypothetical protein LC593_21915 [Nostoc sp. CHAB 5844]|nr:hypothetical protein [Nostoc sp. CHAB 5844]
MGSHRRGVSVAIFDVGASAVRWAALPTVTRVAFDVRKPKINLGVGFR